MKRSVDEEQRERIHESSKGKATASKPDAPQNGSLARKTPTNPASGKRRFAAFLMLCLLGSAAGSYGVFKYIAPSVVARVVPGVAGLDR